MPAKSQKQQKAMGIAHAVEKGELPKSSLKGASKHMYKSMKGTGKLHKFAATKRKGLPVRVKESLAFKLIREGRDDVGKLNLGAEGQDYARMSSSDVMDQPGGVAKKVGKRYNMIKAVTNQKDVAGFPSMDKVGPVKSAIKESLIARLIRA